MIQMIDDSKTKRRVAIKLIVEIEGDVPDALIAGFCMGSVVERMYHEPTQWLKPVRISVGGNDYFIPEKTK